MQYSSSHKYNYIHTGSFRNNRNRTPQDHLKGKRIRKQEPISIEKAKMSDIYYPQSFKGIENLCDSHILLGQANMSWPITEQFIQI